MKIIIPVAGVGSRLRPHTFSAPKVLLNVAGKPIIGHIMSELVRRGMSEIIVVTGHLGQMVKGYLTNSFSANFQYVNQDIPLGLGHAVWLTRKLFTKNEPAWIILGDTIFNVDFKKVLKSNKSMLGVKRVANPERFGIVEEHNGEVAKLVEKPENPTSNLALVGIYYIKNTESLFSNLDRLISRNQKTKDEFQLTDALHSMIEAGEKFSSFLVDEWYDCGMPEDMLLANRELLGKHKFKNKKMNRVVINEPVFIDKTAEVENSIIGPYATISKGSIIKNSLIKNAIVSEFAMVDSVMLNESIIGKSVRVTGGYQMVSIGDYSEVLL